jgi:hypothetical protein
LRQMRRLDSTLQLPPILRLLANQYLLWLSSTLASTILLRPLTAQSHSNGLTRV